jgi:hypothetical protein
MQHRQRNPSINGFWCYIRSDNEARYNFAVKIGLARCPLFGFFLGNFRRYKMDPRVEKMIFLSGHIYFIEILISFLLNSSFNRTCKYDMDSWAWGPQILKKRKMKLAEDVSKWEHN